MLNALRAFSVLAFVGAASLVAVAPGAFAQGASIAFGGIQQDTTLPVEVTADQLSVNQGDGTAVFTGNVLVVQGDLRMAAGTVQVEYNEARTGILRLHATEGVTLTNPTDAAESKEAVYTIEEGVVVMTGDVLLTQGQNALSGQKLVINLQTGTGVMEGRVQTVFQPGTPKK
ncbi:MAG: LptA/OstA family protein [Paracoccaceae bacterium]|nr:LptA/OstA family protein [Paracoccaceae bacterium]